MLDIDYDSDSIIGTEFPLSAVNEDLDWIDADLSDRYNSNEISEENEDIDLDIN